MRLLSIKPKYDMPNRCFNDVLHLMQETTPTPNRIPQGFIAAKKKVKELGLDYKAIHCCLNGCMIYYKKDAHPLTYNFCGNESFQK